MRLSGTNSTLSAFQTTWRPETSASQRTRRWSILRAGGVRRSPPLPHARGAAGARARQGAGSRRGALPPHPAGHAIQPAGKCGLALPPGRDRRRDRASPRAAGRLRARATDPTLRRELVELDPAAFARSRACSVTRRRRADRAQHGFGVAVLGQVPKRQDADGLIVLYHGMRRIARSRDYYRYLKDVAPDGARRRCWAARATGERMLPRIRAQGPRTDVALYC